MNGLAKIAYEWESNKEWQELNRRYEQQSENINQVKSQMNPQLARKSEQVPATVAGIGTGLGALAGAGLGGYAGLSGAVKAGKNKKPLKAVSRGITGLVGAGVGAIPGAIGGLVVGMGASDIPKKRYEKKLKNDNPELWSQYESEISKLHDIERDLEEVESKYDY
jgi:hypothetical protein